MSVVNNEGERVELTRPPLNIWSELAQVYATDARKLRCLCQLILSEVCDYSTRQIGQAFGDDHGVVARNIRDARVALQQHAKPQSALPARDDAA